MPTPTSQGAYVVWNSAQIGYLTRFRVAPQTAVYSDKTNVTCTVVGTGNNSRVIRRHDAVAIDPGTAEVTLYGCPAALNQVGLRSTLLIAFDGGTISLEAFLDSFEVTGQVGEFLTGQAVFKFTGA